MNKERVFIAIMDMFEATGHYNKVSNDYQKKHGFGAFLDYAHGMDSDTRKVEYAYQRDKTETEAWWTIREIFEFTNEQSDRLYTATRFLRKWYERTEWAVTPRKDMIDRLWAFVIG